MILRLGALLCCLQLVPVSQSSKLPSGLIPEVASYAKVSRTGNAARKEVSQARGFQDASISRSPVYVAPKTSKLRNGEALDHPSTPGYSTLDTEALAHLDALSVTSRKKAQDRFHPPASFEHVLAHSNAMRQQQQQSSSGPSSSSSGPSSSSSSSSGTSQTEPRFPVPDYATLPRDVYSPNYNYGTDSASSSIKDSSLTSGDDYPPDSTDSFAKIPDSYQQPQIFQPEVEQDSPKFAGFSSTSYGDKYPSKPPVDFIEDFDHPAFHDDPHHHHHDYPHDLIYDHPPFHTTTTTTEEPQNDQRLSKRPYSYYYIGKKLWYLPLYFSIYFIIYIAALVLKSITRHKINFPASLAAVAADARHLGPDWEAPSWMGLTRRVLDAIDTYNSIEKTTTSRPSTFR